jgi:Trp operon repressor
MKRKPEELDAKARKHCLELVVTTASDASKHDALEEFFRGLLTHSEQVMLGRRIWIARLLIAKKSYQEIGAELHVGPNTIRRTELWLRGLLPDYEKILVEVERASLRAKRRRVAKSNPFSLTALKLKYPLYFLLFPHPEV